MAMIPESLKQKFDALLQKNFEDLTCKLQGPDHRDAPRFLPDDAPFDVLRSLSGRRQFTQLYEITSQANLLPDSLRDLSTTHKQSADTKCSAKPRIPSDEPTTANGGPPSLAYNDPSYGTIGALFDQPEAVASYHQERKGSDKKSRSILSDAGSAASDDGTECWRRVISEDDPKQRLVKIFATLVFAGVRLDSTAWKSFLHLIVDQREDGTRITDESLPFKNFPAVDAAFPCNNAHDEMLNANIFRHQEKVAPWKIPEYLEVHDSSGLRPLPYSSVEKLDSDAGSRYEYYRVKILADHQAFGYKGEWLFRKDVPRGSLDAKIGRILKVNPVQTSYIVENRAIIVFPETITLLSEYGKCNLQKRMTDPSRHPKTFVKDKIKQFAGILDPGRGLQHYHEGLWDPKTGTHTIVCHGDVTPHNVLIFDREGEEVLRIVDNSASGLKCGDGDWVFNGLQGDGCAFLPPECWSSVHRSKPGRGAPTIDQHADVFSYGCLCLEWAVFVWGGPDELRWFRCHRESKDTDSIKNLRFWKVKKDGMPKDDSSLPVVIDNGKCLLNVHLVLKDAVNALRDRIDEECEQSEKDFFQRIIRILVENALQPDPKKRASMKLLLEKLERAIKGEPDILSFWAQVMEAATSANRRVHWRP